MSTTTPTPTSTPISSITYSSQPEFSLGQARAIIADLFEPKPWIYWTDFLVSISVGIFCFSMVRHPAVTLFSPAQILFFLVSCWLYYRVAMFIHEMVHLRSGTFGAFRFAWNMFCGIPFLMPSFVYYTHVDHHRRRNYGTERDGEYMPLGHRPKWHIVVYMLGNLIIPPLAIIRFFLLTPLTWFSPRLRNAIHRRASSMVMDPSYIRPLPSEQMMRTIRLQEVLCFLWCLGIAVVPPVFLNRWPIPFLIHAYATGVFIITLNAIRTLGAHRWTNAEGEMTFLEQFLDTLNYPYRAPITEFWGPTGTRYHALHHLFPSLPYHNLPAAHQRLMEQLPEDSPYRRSNQVTLIGALLELWKRPRVIQESEDSNVQAQTAA